MDISVRADHQYLAVRGLCWIRGQAGVFSLRARGMDVRRLA